MIFVRTAFGRIEVRVLKEFDDYPQGNLPASVGSVTAMYWKCADLGKLLRESPRLMCRIAMLLGVGDTSREALQIAEEIQTKAMQWHGKVYEKPLIVEAYDGNASFQLNVVFKFGMVGDGKVQNAGMGAMTHSSNYPNPHIVFKIKNALGEYDNFYYKRHDLTNLINSKAFLTERDIQDRKDRGEPLPDVYITLIDSKTANELWEEIEEIRNAKEQKAGGAVLSFKDDHDERNKAQAKKGYPIVDRPLPFAYLIVTFDTFHLLLRGVANCFSKVTTALFRDGHPLDSLWEVLHGLDISLQQVAVRMRKKEKKYKGNRDKAMIVAMMGHPTRHFLVNVAAVAKHLDLIVGGEENTAVLRMLIGGMVVLCDFIRESLMEYTISNVERLRELGKRGRHLFVGLSKKHKAFDVPIIENLCFTYPLVARNYVEQTGGNVMEMSVSGGEGGHAMSKKTLNRQNNKIGRFAISYCRRSDLATLEAIKRGKWDMAHEMTLKEKHVEVRLWTDADTVDGNFQKTPTDDFSDELQTVIRVFNEFKIEGRTENDEWRNINGGRGIADKLTHIREEPIDNEFEEQALERRREANRIEVEKFKDLDYSDASESGSEEPSVSDTGSAGRRRKRRREEMEETDQSKATDDPPTVQPPPAKRPRLQATTTVARRKSTRLQRQKEGTVESEVLAEGSGSDTGSAGRSKKRQRKETDQSEAPPAKRPRLRATTTAQRRSTRRHRSPGPALGTRRSRRVAK